VATPGAVSNPKSTRFGSSPAMRSRNLAPLATVDGLASPDGIFVVLWHIGPLVRPKLLLGRVVLLIVHPDPGSNRAVVHHKAFQLLGSEDPVHVVVVSQRVEPKSQPLKVRKRDPAWVEAARKGAPLLNKTVVLPTSRHLKKE
jgi:hypothetical protein